MAGKIDRMWVNKEIALFNRSGGEDADRDSARARLDDLADKILAHLRIPPEKKEELIRFLEMSTSELGTVETTGIEIWDNFFGASTQPTTTPTQAVERQMKLEQMKPEQLVEQLLSEQAIPNGSMVLFDTKGMGNDEFGSDIARHNGSVFKVLSLELDYPGSNNKDYEYYNIELDGKKVYTGISGLHLTPLSLPPGGGGLPLSPSLKADRAAYARSTRPPNNDQLGRKHMGTSTQ